MSELRGLQLSIDEIRATGTEVMAICVDSPEKNREVARTHQLDFPILSDPDGRAARAFGVLHEGASMDGGDIARPALFLVDGGSVRWRELTENWRIRARPADVVQALEAKLGS